MGQILSFLNVWRCLSLPSFLKAFLPDRQFLSVYWRYFPLFSDYHFCWWKPALILIFSLPPSPSLPLSISILLSLHPSLSPSLPSLLPLYLCVTFLSLFCLELIGFPDFKDWCLASVLEIRQQTPQMLLSHIQSPPLFWNIKVANLSQSMISIICVSQHLFPIFLHFFPLHRIPENFFRYIFQFINFFAFSLLYLFPYIIQNSIAHRLKT